MDSSRRLILFGNQKGMALVYMAFLLVVIFGFLGLAVDMGYMYIAKGQLQNAADSAALAGASQLLTTAGVDQPLARAEASSFAAKNDTTANNKDAAQGVQVLISSNGSNTLSDANDITVGNWDPAGHPLQPYEAARTPINAVQVQARRTDNSTGGPINLFFSKVLDSRWSQMGVAATAIASRSPRAGFYFMIGRNVCSSTTFPVSLSPPASNMAWSSLLDPSTSAIDVKTDFICIDKAPHVQVCGKSVYTTGGNDNTIFQATETDFFDPNYDSVNKKIESGKVIYWDVIVPVSTTADPTLQPTPKPVWGYAKIRITKACGGGGGNACKDRTDFKAPNGVCESGEVDIVISQITCVSCEESDDMIGARAGLVK